MKMRSLPYALASLLAVTVASQTAFAANPSQTSVSPSPQASPSVAPAPAATQPAKPTAPAPSAQPASAPAPGAPAAQPASAPAPAAPAAPPPAQPGDPANAAPPAAAAPPDVEPISTGDAGPPDDAPPPIAKEIVVSRSQEKLIAYENGNPVLETAVTTGGPRTPTPLGTFHVLGKRNAFMMTSPWPEDDWRWYKASWVNYALLFESSGYFLHDAPWRHNFGPGSNSVFGTAGGDFTGTHGCVNVPLQDEIRLFFWADVGTPVTVVP